MNVDKARYKALTTSHQSLPPRKRKRTATRTHPKKRQTFLDFGQKSFKQYELCRKCGFLFSNGVEEDDIQHKRFCTQFAKGIVLTKWKNEVLLRSFPNASGTDDRIVELRFPIHSKKLEEIKAVVDNALGFVEIEQFQSRSHFVYVVNNQVIGYIGSEKITHGFTIQSDAANAPLQLDSDPVAAHVGICQMWTHPSYRRIGVATKLIDAVRDTLIYGLKVHKNHIAFSQPTIDGFAFASKYVSPHLVLAFHHNKR